MYKLTHSISLALEEVSSIELITQQYNYSPPTHINIYMKNGVCHKIVHTYGYDAVDVYKLKSLLEQAIDATSRTASES